jgi:outer membrane protein assembly factor BamB
MMAVALLAWRAHAADWPQWLGPQRTGIAADAPWQWPAGGPKIAWRAKIGIGFSSMAVAGGRVVAMGNQGGQEVVACYQADSGKRLWEHRYPAALVDNLHEGGPCSTPTIHQDRVYVVGKEGLLHCLNMADGSVAWRIDLRRELGVRTPEWGFCSSPVIHERMLILQAGPTAAFDKADGKLIWKSTDAKPGYSTPAVFELGGRPLLATLNSSHLLVLDLTDGKELAGASWKTSFDTNSTTPIVIGDTIFVSTGYDKGCALFRFESGQLTTIYRNKSMRNHMNNSILLDGHLYGFDGNSHRAELVDLVCLEAATGTAKWRQNGLGCGSLLISDGKLLLLSDEGTLAAAQASPAGYKELGQARVLEGRCWTMPALADGRAYCRNADGDLVCVDLRNQP